MEAPRLEDVTLASVRLEDLVEARALEELVTQAAQLFGVPMRMLDPSGRPLARGGEPLALHVFLSTFPRVGAELRQTDEHVQAAPLRSAELRERCVTGTWYWLVALEYDGRPVGRLIVGPFAEPGWSELPGRLFELEPTLEPRVLEPLIAAVPRLELPAVQRIGRYLAQTLDLVLFSGHKAWLTGTMHSAAMQESYRELSDRNLRLQHAYERLKELDRLKSNFLATVSHELRTPLTSIIGYSEMLGEGLAGELSSEQQEFVQTIRQKGEQLLDLIKGLLDLSKLESGTMSLRKQELLVQPVIEDVAQTLAPAAKKKGVQLGVSVEPGLPSVWGDKERLRQILLNLTENAIKFTPQEGAVKLGARVVSIEAPQSKEAGGLVLTSIRRTAVELRVADTGIGVPEHERERIFDAFYQVDGSSTREQGGTGLGLSIVRRLVEAHDGAVRVEDNSPRGTVFVVTIPCRRASIL